MENSYSIFCKNVQNRYTQDPHPAAHDPCDCPPLLAHSELKKEAKWDRNSIIQEKWVLRRETSAVPETGCCATPGRNRIVKLYCCPSFRKFISNPYVMIAISYPAMELVDAHPWLGNWTTLNRENTEKGDNHDKGFFPKTHFVNISYLSHVWVCCPPPWRERKTRREQSKGIQRIAPWFLK